MGSVLCIEVAGGLVGKNDGWLEDEGTGQGYSLLLTAGKLNWIVMHAVCQAYTAQ